MHVQDFAVEGDYAYIVEVREWNGSEYVGGGVHMMNIANPSAPLETGYYQTPRIVVSTAVACKVAYVAEHPNWDSNTLHKIGGGLHIISFNNAAAPTELGYYRVTGK